MRCANSYQDIKGPDEIEEKRTFDSIYHSLLDEYDPEEGSYKAYESWCRKKAREIMAKEIKENDRRKIWR